MLQVMPLNMYTVSFAKENADTRRYQPCLVKATNKVLVIAGYDLDTWSALSTVSSYDILSDSWSGNLPKLNVTRCSASVCLLKATIYVFCGNYNGECLNTIETISETSLVSSFTACWQVIEVPRNILTPRFHLAVAPISDTEIAILGGWTGDTALSDVVLFKTTT